jgi:copper(I)-binding protein
MPTSVSPRWETDMKPFSSILIPLLLVSALVPSNGSAQEFKAGALVINQPWSRATAGGAKVGAGYMTITNNGSQPDRLVGGSLPQAEKVEVHEMRLENNVMTMRPVPGGLEIKPGQTVKLEPGGYHVMFMQLKEPLKQGEVLKGELTFEKAGTVSVEYKVGTIAAGAPGAKQGH